MIGAETFPLWAAIAVSVFMVAGAAMALIGSLGLVQLDTFYNRVHAPTLGTSLGAILTLSASIIYFSTLQSRPIFHEIIIAVFIILTTPISFMLLVRAALHRDRSEGDETVPQLDANQ